MFKSCVQCSLSFEITDQDLQFYDKVSPVFNGRKFQIPPPTLCPDCRRQRKLAWRNERTLYHHPCNLCGKDTITVHAPDRHYPVYCNPCWWSDRWDPLQFGLVYDPSQSFLEQFRRLMSRAPQRAMVNDDGVMSENCAYTFDVAFSRNCSMCFGMWKSQDCLYCRICDQSRFCVDCEGVKLGSELVYDSVDSQRLYRSAYLQNSENCSDCFFGFDLKGCSNCIACVGLRQKQFYIFNKPYSEEDYKKYLVEFRLNTRSGVEDIRQKFAKFITAFPRKNMNLQNCENSLGDHLFNCRNVLSGYTCTNSEFSSFIERSDGVIWSYDQVQSGAPELCYECITNDNGYRVLFSMYCNQSQETLYSDNCIHGDHLIGCISLRRKKYCILNTQYSKEEYEKLAAKIIEQMQEPALRSSAKQSEGWGEFFPIQMSWYGYNETNAQEFYPLSEDYVLKNGWKYRKDLPYTTGKETMNSEAFPDAIAEVQDSITKEILACRNCARNYRIIEQELQFYRQMNIPVPDLCPDCRNRARLARRNPQRLWHRACAAPAGGQAKCGQDMMTTYSPESDAVVYCESCYLQAVN